MKQILLDNAYESWKNAVENHDRILSGLSSLKYQKMFVASLHNAIELFLKQLMLNINDRDVAKLSKKGKAENPGLEAAYTASGNLNAFFTAITVDEVNAFHSIEFGELIKKHEDLLDLGSNSFKDALELLQKLRNTETHFYIKANHYLSECDFVALHNLMIEFFQSAVKSKLFPRALIWLEDTSVHLENEESAMEFNRTCLTSFSYIDALKSNSLLSEIVQIMQGEFEAEYAFYGDNNYELAECIVCHNPRYKDRIDDIFTILQLMTRYGLFEVHTECEEIELDNGERFLNREDSFEFHF